PGPIIRCQEQNFDAVCVLGSRGVCLLSPENTEVILAQWRTGLKRPASPPLLVRPHSNLRGDPSTIAKSWPNCPHQKAAAGLSGGFTLPSTREGGSHAARTVARTAAGA